MADSDTIGALLSAANTFLVTNEGLAATSIQWENQTFDPSGKSVWAAVFVVPNIPQASTLGGQGRDRGNGFMQIDINIPQGKGEGPFRAWEDAARGYFIVGKPFTRNSQVVTIISCGMGQGRNIDNWHRKSITITYRSDFTRAAI
jgi:hypothetical protein